MGMLEDAASSQQSAFKGAPDGNGGVLANHTGTGTVTPDGNWGGTPGPDSIAGTPVTPGSGYNEAFPGTPETSAVDNLPDVAGNLPDVNTSIDPTAFASGSAQQSQVQTLQPPTDIDAANIGEYSAYESNAGTLDDKSTVEGRLNGLLSQNGDYIKRARTSASQMANRSGMLNTSMAAGAAEGAAIDRALPIAQQDAAAMKEQEFLNQGYSEDAAKYLAEQSVERENLDAGLKQDTNQFNATQKFEADKLNQAATNTSNREFTAAENKQNFAVLSADLQGQLAGIDNKLAQNLEQMTQEYGLLENLDSVNGAIYQQMVSEIGTILANEDRPDVAEAKINALIEASGVEFEFSSGQSSALSELETTPDPVSSNTVNSEDGNGGDGNAGQDGPDNDDNDANNAGFDGFGPDQQDADNTPGYGDDYGYGGEPDEGPESYH